MNRTLTALLIINLSVGVLAVIVGVRSSGMAGDASLRAAEAKAQIEVLDTRSAKCTEAAIETNMLLKNMLEKQ